ncbi:MAG: hypothetical protein R3F30_09295 [Planctomycetota bacterium]
MSGLTRRLLVALFVAAALVVGLDRLPYRMTDQRVPMLGTRLRMSRPLELGPQRSLYELPSTVADFDLEARLVLARGEALKVAFRVSQVRKGLADFEVLRFIGGQALALQDGTIEVPAGAELPIRLSGRGYGWELEAGDLRLAGTSRFAHGYTAFQGAGIVNALVLTPTGPPPSPLGGHALELAGVGFVLTFLLLSSGRLWPLVLVLVLGWAGTLYERYLAADPRSARATDLLREGREAELLEAFGAYHPERTLDLELGVLHGDLGVHLPEHKRGPRVLVLGFDSAGQEASPPTRRWYAPLGQRLVDASGKQVEVMHAFHTGARPSACLAGMRRLIDALHVDLVVVALAPSDLLGFEADAQEPSTEGWSSLLALNALGLAEARPTHVFAGEDLRYEHALAELRGVVPVYQVEPWRGALPWTLGEEDRAWALTDLVTRISAQLH